MRSRKGMGKQQPTLSEWESLAKIRLASLVKCLFSPPRPPVRGHAWFRGAFSALLAEILLLLWEDSVEAEAALVAVWLLSTAVVPLICRKVLAFGKEWLRFQSDFPERKERRSWFVPRAAPPPTHTHAEQEQNG